MIAFLHARVLFNFFSIFTPAGLACTSESQVGSRFNGGATFHINCSLSIYYVFSQNVASILLNFFLLDVRMYNICVV